MFIGIIYKYTSPSGKIYIGQTTQSLSERARFMGEGYRNCTAFYRAIQKYGFQNFSQEVLEEISYENLSELKEQLNKLEQYYISKFNSLVPNGYNIRLGGEVKGFSSDSQVCKTGSEHFNWRNDIDEKQLQDLYLSGKNLKEIAFILNLPTATIQRHLKEADVLREKRYNSEVVKLNTKGEIVESWKSASEAARAEGKHASVINRCCREKRGYYKGYTYRYKGDEK